MPVFHHIRYARSVRFGEPELTAFEEPSIAPVIPSSCPQNKFRLDYIMGNGEPAAQDEDCHFLSIYTPFLFGPWERWKDAGILRGISREEWEQRGGALRRQWLDFIR